MTAGDPGRYAMAATPEARESFGHALRRAASYFAFFLLFATAPRSFAALAASGAPLLQPTSVAYDTAGNLYFAESRNHVVRKVDTTGLLTTVAGSTVQGFAGDGGPATAAELDTPRGVALDSAGNIYIADTHNHRIRCVDAATQHIRTLAGTGLATFSGDGDAATKASLNGPLGLALDAGGHLYIADSGNQRLRMVDLASGLISTVAGTGQQGFSGDNGPALAATFNEPSGLAADQYGNLFISDTGNHRIREVSSATRKVLTLAGDGTSGVRLSRPEGLSLDLRGGLLISDAGTNNIYLFDLASGRLSIIAGQGHQAFQGDQGLATLAMLDSPTGVAFRADGQIVVADTDNGRLRQISSESGGDISTIAGMGRLLPSMVVLTSSALQTYGSASATTVLRSATPGSGVVSLSEAVAGQLQLLATSALAGNSATFDLSALSAGTHQLQATYTGDGTHQPAQSVALSLTIAPMPVSASLTTGSLVYGQTLPVFAGTLAGVLPRDQSNLRATFSLAAAAFPLAPASYPLTITLTGSAAGNYVLTQGTVNLSVTEAPAVVSLSHDAAGFAIGVVSSTTGHPTGAVALMTAAGNELASVPVGASGQTTLSDAGLTPGTYSVVALYSGDVNFLSSRSVATTVTLGQASPAPSPPDFSIKATGGSTQSMPPGGTANFTFAVAAAGQAMAGPILLAVQGEPQNSSVAFNPTLITPGTTAATVTLSVALPRASTALKRTPGIRVADVAFLLPIVLLPFTRKRPRRALLSTALGLPFLLLGCGDRTFGTQSSTSSAQSYALQVTGTTTLANGSSLQHSTTVNLTIP